MGIKTSGDYDYEIDSAKEFDQAIEDSGLFWIEKEVTGTIFSNWKMLHGEKKGKRVRLDRLLTPKKKFTDIGWDHGPIGIELKRSGLKTGHPISQVLDYRNSLFKSPLLQFSRIMPTMFFIFPLDKYNGEIASIMAQNWFGTASIIKNKYRNDIRFFFGEVPILEIDLNSPQKPKFAKKLPGRKYGSR